MGRCRLVVQQLPGARHGGVVRPPLAPRLPALRRGRPRLRRCVAHVGFVKVRVHGVREGCMGCVGVVPWGRTAVRVACVPGAWGCRGCCSMVLEWARVGW